MRTIHDFIKSARITATIKPTDRNPYAENDDWAKTADHWSVWLKCDGHRMHTYFSMGSGHNGKAPKLCDVLDSMASDAAGYPLDSDTEAAFAEWCGEYGYDTDSRKTHRTFKVIGQQIERLKRLLGPAALNVLCCEVERL